MIVNQDALIRNIAKNEDIHIATVRQVFKSAEDIIFDYLSSSPPTNDVNIKIFNGISIRRKYVDRRKYSKGLFQNINCPEHVKVKSDISRYFNEKINNKIFYNNKRERRISLDTPMNRL